MNNEIPKDVTIVVTGDDPEKVRRVRLIIRDAMWGAGFDGGPIVNLERRRLRLLPDPEKVS